MADQYDIIYVGRLRPDADRDKFIEAFGKQFGVSVAQAAKLADSGKEVTLKRGLSQEQAEKYRRGLEALGMVIRLNPVGGGAFTLDAGPPPAPPAALAREPKTARGAAVTCPKCGSSEVDGDLCQSCGVVVSKFLAAQARAKANAPQQNPYAAPEADLTEPTEEGEMSGPHKVPAGHGWDWIRGGFGHFRRNPGGWLLGLLVMFGIAFVAGLIPAVGSLIFSLLSPVFLAGFMLGARDQENDGDFEVRHVFAGFSANTGQLVLVGLVYMAGAFLIGILMAFLIGGMMFSNLNSGAMQGMPPPGFEVQQGLPAQGDVGMQGGSGAEDGGWPAEEEQAGGQIAFDPGGAQFEPGALDGLAMINALFGPGFWLAMLLAMALLIPLMMAYWFAPALVALNGLSALPAMRLSFVACMRNMLPFLVYGLIAILLMIVAVIPVGLGLLVFAPVMMASIYTAYRDIFYGVETTV